MRAFSMLDARFTREKVRGRYLHLVGRQVRGIAYAIIDAAYR